MKNTKNNNKGFSLVELIVVVLIMAIIAVALAPQVMKWVNNSKLATDIQTGDTVVSAMQIAYATNKPSGTPQIELKKATVAPTGEDSFWNAVKANLGGAFPNLKSDGTITIKVDANGKISTEYSSDFTSNTDLGLSN